MSNSTILVAALGDSITAGTPYWDPDPEVRERMGDGADERHQWPYWAERSDPRIRIRNHGVDLERTDEIAARLEEALKDAHVLIVQGGINDVVQGRAPEETIADLRRMIVRAKEARVRVAIANLLPWNNGFPEKEPAIRDLNTRIAALAQAEDVHVLNFYGTLEDHDRPGRMREDWTADGNHPSLDGHRRLGELAFRLSA
jgi:lysophospholipase L1-like esterase